MTLDLSILFLSLLFSSIYLLSPIEVELLIVEYSLFEQLYFINIVSLLLLATVSVVQVGLSRKTILKNIIMIIGFLSLATHYCLEFIMLGGGGNVYMKGYSIFFYQIVGTLVVPYIFLENFNTNTNINTNANANANKIMWTSIVIAIFTIPAILIHYWLAVEKELVYLAVGITSLILGIAIVWRFSILIKDIVESRDRLLKTTETDALTGLLNYNGCSKLFSSREQRNCLLIVIDIDDFKSINDLFGREKGDDVLKSLTEKLNRLEDVKLIGRLGANKFIVSFQLAEMLVEAKLDALKKELGSWDIINGERIAVPLTFGAAFNGESISSSTALKRAEDALFYARQQFLGTYIHTKKEGSDLISRHEIQSHIQKAIEERFLPVHIQPIYNLANGSLKALEVLIRIHSDKHGLLLPGQFLEQAQPHGELSTLTNICVEIIAKEYNQLPNVTINLNLPPYMLINKSILNQFLISFKVAKLSPSNFCIEILEDQDSNADDLLKSIKKLKKMGFSVAMDDYGTGYSSLSRLSSLPFDVVKIDRSLLLTASIGKTSILESTVSLLQKLKMSVVVEGVETIEQLSLIKSLGVDSAQGYLLSKPLNVNQAKTISLDMKNIASIAV